MSSLISPTRNGSPFDQLTVKSVGSPSGENVAVAPAPSAPSSSWTISASRNMPKICSMVLECWVRNGSAPSCSGWVWTTSSSTISTRKVPFA